MKKSKKKQSLATKSSSKSLGKESLGKKSPVKKAATTAASTKQSAAKRTTKPTGQKKSITVPQLIEQLKSLGNEKVRAHNAKHGADDHSQFGVKLGDIRTLANQIKTNHELALELWQCEIVEAKLLATLIIRPQQLTADELDQMVKAVSYAQLADWLHSYVVKVHPESDKLREQWMVTDNAMGARAGWRLTAGRVAKSPTGLDLVALLDRIEAEMATAPSEVQWTMNMCLAEIGIHFAKHRKRAIAIGERLGLYRDYPVSKGCTSPFAPIWINEMVHRQTIG